jgi:hypothetical protein
MGSTTFRLTNVIGQNGKPIELVISHTDDSHYAFANILEENRIAFTEASNDES